MGITESVKEFYYSLEDKWYEFVDSVSEKVPAFGTMIDTIEDKGIPSFPVAIILLLLILLIIVVLLAGGNNATLTVSILNENAQPIEGATVIVLAENNPVGEQQTNSEGKTSFALAKGSYSIKVEKGEKTDTKTIELTGDTEQEFTLRLEDLTISKSVYLKNADNSLIDGTGTVIYRCKGTTDEKSASYFEGKFTATIKQGCNEVEVLSIQNYKIINGTVSFSAGNSVIAEKEQIKTGTAIVTIGIQGTTEQVPAALKVSLVPVSGTTPIQKITTGTAIVVFEQVPIGKYYTLIVDSTGTFETYDGSKTTTEVKDIMQNQTTNFESSLIKTSATEIKITVLDSETGKALQGAEIKLVSATNTNDVRKETTGATGQKTFKVGINTTYNLTADHPQYLIATSTVSAGQEKTIELEKVTEANAAAIKVKVIDSKKIPVENARVILTKVDPSAPIAGETTTGISGEAEFTNLELGSSYIATASKEGFGSAAAQSIQLTTRGKKEIELTFNIGYGTIRVKVLDTEKNPLIGASVKPVDYYDTTAGASKTTGTEGTAEFLLRADKKTYFVIETSSYMRYFTAPVKITTEKITEKTVLMVKKTAKAEVLPITILSGESEVTNTQGEEEDSVAPGEYKAIATLVVPSGAYNEAGIHLRTGKQDTGITNLMEEDGLFISDAESSGRMMRGTTYTPPNGYATDSKNIVGETEAKWVNAVWKNPQEGAYELEAQITVTETNPNVKLSVFYRGWVKGTTTLRDPASNIQANELYAPVKERVLTLGATNLCSGTFCKAYTIQAQTGTEAFKKKFITQGQTFEAKKDTQYLLTMDLTNYSNKPIIGAELRIEGKSLDVNAISINGIEQTELTASLGTIGIDMPLKLEILFTPTAAGTSGVKITITSKTQTELEETVPINIKPNKKMYLSIIPKVIVPYIKNTMFFEVKDGNNAIQGVLITIKNGTTILGDIETTSEGLATFELAEPKTGDIITIIAQKEGYDTLTVEKTADEAILTITPPEIEETIKVGDIAAMTEEIIMTNNTAKSVKIISTEIVGEVKTYLDVKFSGTTTGTIIEQGKDRNYSLSMKVNNTAQRIKEPIDLTGKAIINTQIVGTDEEYQNEISMAIHLTLPGFMDNGKCLKANPNTVELIAGESEVTKTITLTNNCTAEGIKIPLHNLEAKLNEAAKFGTITLAMEGGKTISLSDKATELAELMEKDMEANLTIKYSPNLSVTSGTQELTITIDGKNNAEDGTKEKTETQVKATTTMNNLTKCVEIEQPEGGLLLDIAPWNLGYGRLAMSDYSSYMSPYAQNYGGFTNRTAPYNMGMMQGMGMQGYGTMGYGMGAIGYGSFNSYNTPGQSGGTRTMSYEQNAFTIKNNCATDIEIDLDPDPRINVSEDKFTIDKDSDNTILVEPGYVLGKYKIKVNAKPVNTEDSKKKIDEISVTVRRLGDLDKDCIKANITKISLNSLVQRPQKYSVYNYCYDTGVQLARNRIATIECSAPMPALGAAGQEPYFEQGKESVYGNAYPLTGAYSTYYDYIGTNMQGNGCPADSCSLTSGTRVWFRNLQQGGPYGTIEKVDFQVYPNTEYIPQRKLFGSQGYYGPFQNIVDVRRWLTEADSRINVYGKLNISYTNQYGIGECMEFPIQVEDMWRLGEILDSAVNWGDPTANPEECQNKDALNIIEYWSRRGIQKGVIPEQRYTNGNYIHIAEPAALKIGPAQTTQTQYYPMYETYWTTNQGKKGSGDATKNCGLLDSITITTQIAPETVGGLNIQIDSTPLFGGNASGSFFNNTRGANLIVSIDRTNMTSNCIHLQVPITGKVSRKANFQSQELTWVLNAIVTKPGIEYRSEEECKLINVTQGTTCIDKLRQALSVLGQAKLKVPAEISKTLAEVIAKNKECAGQISEYDAQRIAEELLQTTGELCAENKTEYGITKIKTTEVKNLLSPEDCTTYFCNNDMLQAFLLNKFAKIKEKVAGITLTGKATKLSELYKEALLNNEFKNCAETTPLKFYKQENGTLIGTGKSYPLPTEVLNADDKKTIIAKGEGALPIIAMWSAIQNIGTLKAEEYKNILLEVDASKVTTVNDEMANTLKMTKIGTGTSAKYYMTLKAYEELNNSLGSDPGYTGCNDEKDSAKCKIDWCGLNQITLKPEVFKWMAEKGILIQGISDKETMSAEEKEKIYKANTALNEIHKLALFSTESNKTNTGLGKNLKLTAITDTGKALEPALFTTGTEAIKDLTLEFSAQKTEVGEYETELDYDLGKETKKATVKLGEKKTVEGASKAENNILLKTGFEVEGEGVNADEILNNMEKGTILEESAGKMKFYKRVPVKLVVGINGNETGISYSPRDISVKPKTLLNWYTETGLPKGTDTQTGAFYIITVTPSREKQTIKTIYYYPENGALEIAKSNIGGTVDAKTLAFITATRTTSIPTGTQGNTTLEISEINGAAKNITLEKILEQISKDNACFTTDSIEWNTAKLLKQ